MIIKGREFIALTAPGGTCAGCTGQGDRELCYQMRLQEDCGTKIFRECGRRYKDVNADEMEYDSFALRQKWLAEQATKRRVLYAQAN